MSRTAAERKEALAEERSAQILDAAARLFATQGYHQTTTRQIAAEAGVAEGTIYNYFAGKQDLLLAMLKRVAEMDELTQNIGALPTGDPRLSFAEFFENRLEIIERNLDIFRALLPQIVVDPDLRDQMLHRFAGSVLGALHRYVEAQIGAGVFRPVDAALHVRLVQALFVGMMLMEIAGDETLWEKRDQSPEAVAELLWEGWAARPGPDGGA